ncbi:MAG: phosphopentomutase [Bacillota bacterium]|nr:phosphopentomutase [Bacillota bacterium]
MSRFIIIVMDSVGVGALPDAAEYGDPACNTLGHIAEQAELRLPCMQRLGLGNILPLRGVEPQSRPLGAYGKAAAKSRGMDTTCGHWEIAGLLLDRPLPTFPHGFPPQLLDRLSAVWGRGVIGNRVASGTQIVSELGEQHQQSGALIVYTSADSVMQIAAHTDTVPIEELYDICRQARALLSGDYGVGRVIARPFTGSPGAYRRTEQRQDFSLDPPPHGLLQVAQEGGAQVVAIGKINDVFAGRHIDAALEGHNNRQTLTSLAKALRERQQRALIFANCVDFDTLYGHRNDVAGYARALMEFDSGLEQLLPLLHEDDILAVTADHGNDPTTGGTDHNREYAPLLLYGAGVKAIDLGIRGSFADLGATAADYLGCAALPAGESFLPLIADHSRRKR